MLAPKEIREGLLEEVVLELSLDGDLSFRRQGMVRGIQERGQQGTSREARSVQWVGDRGWAGGPEAQAVG